MRTLRNISGIIFLLMATAVVSAQEAPADIQIGEPLPDIEAADFINYDGKPTLDKFRERVVVVFFFQPTGVSVDSIPTVNDAYKKFGQSGVVFVGLTPAKKSDAESVVSGKEVKFPVGFEAPTENKYAVTSFPQIYLLDTSGRLVNRFHPGEDLEEKIRTQMKRTPPRGADPTRLKLRYEQAAAALQRKDIGIAFTLASDVQRVADEKSEIGQKVKKLVEQINKAAEEWLDEAKDAAKDEEYDKACKILAELSVRFKGEDIAGKADTEIGRLMGDRTVKPKINSAIDNVKGEVINERAADHESLKEYLEARNLYREVVQDYPKTEAAEKAEKAIERINNDPMAKEAIERMLANEEADRWLDIGDRFAKVEMYDKAREYYQRVIEVHPTSRARPKAEEQLRDLPEPEPVEEDEFELPEGDEDPSDGE